VSDLRILVAAALNASDLSPSDLRETAVDRIGALAFADELGGALWSLKWGGNLRVYVIAERLLVKRSKPATPSNHMRGRLCRLALAEWFDDRCPNCHGRGTHMATPFAPVRHCEACDGSGKRPVSELGRAAALGVDIRLWRKWEPAYGVVQRKLTDAEDRAWVDIARQLGRIDNNRYRLQTLPRRPLSVV
jgi:hypothetical protein